MPTGFFTEFFSVQASTKIINTEVVLNFVKKDSVSYLKKKTQEKSLFFENQLSY